MGQAMSVKVEAHVSPRQQINIAYIVKHYRILGIELHTATHNNQYNNGIASNIACLGTKKGNVLPSQRLRIGVVRGCTERMWFVSPVAARRYLSGVMSRTRWCAHVALAILSKTSTSFCGFE